MALVLTINIIATAIFYWMKRKQKERRSYYTDRFYYILNELTERLKKLKAVK